jgi:hypothetical protein
MYTPTNEGILRTRVSCWDTLNPSPKARPVDKNDVHLEEYQIQHPPPYLPASTACRLGGSAESITAERDQEASTIFSHSPLSTSIVPSFKHPELGLEPPPSLLSSVSNVVRKARFYRCGRWPWWRRDGIPASTRRAPSPEIPFVFLEYF